MTADYTWFPAQLPALSEAYCLTLVKRLSPMEVLHRFGASEQSRLTGVDALLRPAYEVWERHDGDQLFVAVTAVGEGGGGDWTLAVEPNGYLGVTEEVVIPLSRGTTVVSHFRNVNAVDRFSWVEDGDVRLSLEPLFPENRYGRDADRLVEVMQRVGFVFDEDEDDDLHPGEAAFALAEHLTGVRLTPQLLESATFSCGVAPVPGFNR